MAFYNWCFAIMGILVSTSAAVSQEQQAHGHGTIFVALAGNSEAARGIRGSATAIFVLSGDAQAPRLSYEVTFNDVALKPAWRIAIRNSAAGGVGKAVHVLCGPEAERKCPEGTSGKIAGHWTAEGPEPFSTNLSFELSSGRLYMALEEADEENSPLRGQIGTSGIMIMPHTRVLSFGSPEAPGEAAGTGVVYLTDMPDGTMLVDYALTVTGLSSAVQGIELGGTLKDKIDEPVFDLLTVDESSHGKAGSNGITVAGLRRISGDAADTLRRSLRGSGDLVDLLIRTEKAPAGEKLTPLGGMPPH